MQTPAGFGATAASALASRLASRSGDGALRETFAGALSVVDGAMRDVVDALARARLHNDSVLVVVSDNGGMVSHGGSNAPLRGEKATLWEGGHRVPAFLHAPSYMTQKPPPEPTQAQRGRS